MADKAVKIYGSMRVELDLEALRLESNIFGTEYDPDSELLRICEPDRLLAEKKHGFPIVLEIDCIGWAADSIDKCGNMFGQKLIYLVFFRETSYFHRGRPKKNKE